MSGMMDLRINRGANAVVCPFFMHLETQIQRAFIASCEMGGFGSGRYGGRSTVESAPRLDIDLVMCWGAVRPRAPPLRGKRAGPIYGAGIDGKVWAFLGGPGEKLLCFRL